MSVKKKLLWITDPWDTLDHPKDTTLRLIEESLKLGIVSYWCDVKSIRFDTDRVVLDARRVEAVSPGRSTSSFRLKATEVFSPRDFTHLFYRTDPPVDLAYLLPLQLLEFALRGAKKSRLVNPARVIFSANEKLEGAAISRLFPRAFVSSNREKLEAFIRKERKVVLKPLYQAQSKGVRVLDITLHSPDQISAALLEPTEGFQVPVILQEFLPEIEKGENRLWFVNGKLLGAVRKKPKAGEVVINMDQGGSVTKTVLNTKEKAAVLQIGRYLKSQGIEWAAVDLIQGKVTDFNFTSPGLIVAMEEVLEKNLAAEILKKTVRN